VAAATTVLKIAALAIVAVAGLLAFRAGDVRPVRAHGGSWTPLRSSPPCCFSFLGMEGAVMATNRVRDPESNVPRAIIAGVAGVAVLYLAGTLAVLGTVPQTRLAESGATMRGRSQRSPVSVRRGRAARRAVDPDRHPGLRAGGSWRGAARHGQGER
jgi:amino acid transporter